MHSHCHRLSHSRNYNNNNQTQIFKIICCLDIQCVYLTSNTITNTLSAYVEIQNERKKKKNTYLFRKNSQTRKRNHREEPQLNEDRWSLFTVKCDFVLCRFFAFICCYSLLIPLSWFSCFISVFLWKHYYNLIVSNVLLSSCHLIHQLRWKKKIVNS